MRRHTHGLAALSADRRPAIVFFAPEAGIVPHFMAHALMARTLQERGHRVLVVRCADVYPRCVVMDGLSLPLDMTSEQRAAACAACARSTAQAADQYGLDFVDLRALVDESVRAAVAEQMRNLPENLADFEVAGVKFAQFCGADAAISFKMLDPLGPDPAVRALLLRYLEGALLSYHAMRRLAEQTTVARVVYFTGYGMLLGAVAAARSMGIATTNLTLASLRGVDRRRIILMPQLLTIISYRERLENWNQWRTLPLPESRIAEIADDSLYRVSSNSAMIYSPVRSGAADDVFARLNLSSERRLLVAFTSSLDELLGNDLRLEAVGEEPFPKQQPFRDQIEWLEALIKRVEASDDLQLVVRVHHREGANRRDRTASSHLGTLRARFSRAFDHVRFVWPEETVSSYDLAELAEVGLTAWSTLGLEMARFGVPVVTAFNLHTPFPVGDVVRWHATAPGYFALLDEALKAAPDLGQIKFAYRWSSLRHLGYSLDLGDVVPDSGFVGLPRYRVPAAAATIERALVDGESLLDIDRAALVARQGRDAEDAEHAALRAQLRRCIWYLCVGEDRGRDYRLFFASRGARRIPDGYDAALTSSGNVVEFRSEEHVVTRRSPMVRRLALLAAQNSVEHVEA